MFSSTATTEDNETATASLSPAEAYKKLVEKLETITQLSRAQAVLSYDQQVFMPAAASPERGAQMAALATVVHEQRTNPELLELMNKAMEDENGDADAKRVLELELKAFLENERVPATLAAKAASLSSSAYSDWVGAKEAKNFEQFAPTLQDCFDTAMAIAEAKRGEEGRSSDGLYNQMLDEFEVGMPQSRMDEIFGTVQTALVPLIAKVLKSSTPPSTEALKGEFDIEKQKALSERIVKSIGFNAERGRIDVSVHPFTSSMSPADVRITSRFRTDEWYQGLAGTIHEGGHAIYEQNLSPNALSIDSALSMGTHESQSLFWERHIGLSKPFWKWATPILKETFGDEEELFGKYDWNDIYGAVNAVTQSLIRVEADELTYPLHVILRYNIEKDVIGGTLAVQDISERWNKDMKELLDIDVPSDDKGALQDVHWSALAFGYFPTYLIGAITAAQLFHYCSADVPEMEKKIENGEFTEIQEWLTSKVHCHGRRYTSLDDLLNDQLGEPLNPKYFIDYLEEKYSDLYQL